jgi:hypothetical protein
MLATETRRTGWGAEISAALVRDVIHTGIRHDALRDFINEYMAMQTALREHRAAEAG